LPGVADELLPVCGKRTVLMNWVDILLIVIVVLGAVMGMKIGIIGAAINAAALVIGWVISGQLSDDIGAIFEDSLSNDTWVTVISYVVIMALALVVGRLLGKVVRPTLTVATVGLSSMVDRLGGLGLGLLFGLVIAGAVIIAMARFTYDFETPDEGIAGNVGARLPDLEDTKETIEQWLVDSGAVRAFAKVTDALPGGALGFVPSDFKSSLEILLEAIEEEE